FPSEDDSVHLRLFPEVPAEWRNAELAAKWERIRSVRRVITGALEVERREKRIGSSLEAAPKVYVSEADAALLREIDGAELTITSGIEVIAAGDPPEGAFRLEDAPGIAVVPKKASGEKCQRCWQFFDMLEPGGICARCAGAIATQEAA
ncbi:MAG: isoleucine--tRNA ligase, partial [Pseudomonadota bacterium]